MNNQEICAYVRGIDPNDCEKYISDDCVDLGFGQSCGGYLTVKSGILQRDHFLFYYGKKEKSDKAPTYAYLRCPQLLLFIAEFSGVSRQKVNDACEMLKKYEEENHLRYSEEKNGNYIWGKQILRDLKKQLCISEVVRIMKESESMDEVKEKTKKL